MTEPGGPRRSVAFGRLAVAASIGYVVYLLCRYDLCFQDGEVLTQRMFDEGHQPRLISYLAYIFTFESRLALWRLIPPHPTFSPIWAVTLIAAPLLLYSFLKRELQSTSAALVGTAVYLTSPGYLSGATMMFHPAKPLANVAVIGTLAVCGRLCRERQDVSGRWWILLATLLGTTPFIDGTAVFAYAIPLIWCPALFYRTREQTTPTLRRNWLTLLLPAAVGAIVVLVLLPLLGPALTSWPFNVTAYMDDMATLGAPHAKLDVTHVAWHTTNLFSAELIPWSDTPRVPIAAGPVLRPDLLIAIALAIAAAGLLVARAGRVSGPFVKSCALIAVFICFQTIVVVFHELEISVTGYYYGAIFSVLFAVLVATIAAAAETRPGRTAQLLGRAVVVWILVMSARNFVPLNASWLEHSNAKALDYRPELPVGQYGGDTGLLDDLSGRYHARNAALAPEANAQHYVEDIRRGDTSQRGRTLEIWQRWRSGEPAFLSGEPLAVQDLWLAIELGVLEGYPPRRWLMHITGKGQ